jgi:hypothetical protein
VGDDDGGSEQHQQGGQGAGELETLNTDNEQDAQPNLRAELREDDKYLARLIRQGEAAGLRRRRPPRGQTRQEAEELQARLVRERRTTRPGRQ